MDRAQQYSSTLLRPICKREEQLALRICQLQRRLYAPDTDAKDENESGIRTHYSIESPSLPRASSSGHDPNPQPKLVFDSQLWT